MLDELGEELHWEMHSHLLQACQLTVQETIHSCDKRDSESFSHLSHGIRLDCREAQTKTLNWGMVDPKSLTLF